MESELRTLLDRIDLVRPSVARKLTPDSLELIKKYWSEIDYYLSQKHQYISLNDKHTEFKKYDLDPKRFYNQLQR